MLIIIEKLTLLGENSSIWLVDKLHKWNRSIKILSTGHKNIEEQKSLTENATIGTVRKLLLMMLLRTVRTDR